MHIKNLYYILLIPLVALGTTIKTTTYDGDYVGERYVYFKNSNEVFSNIYSRADFVSVGFEEIDIGESSSVIIKYVPLFEAGDVNNIDESDYSTAISLTSTIPSIKYEDLDLPLCIGVMLALDIESLGEYKVNVLYDEKGYTYIKKIIDTQCSGDIDESANIYKWHHLYNGYTSLGEATIYYSFTNPVGGSLLNSGNVESTVIVTSGIMDFSDAVSLVDFSSATQTTYYVVDTGHYRGIGNFINITRGFTGTSVDVAVYYLYSGEEN